MSLTRIPLLREEAAGWTPRGYSAFRMVLGAYCLAHFGLLAPWAAELFSSSGMLPDASLSPLTRAFPNVLALVDHPTFTTGFVGLAAIAAVPLALGRFDRVAALVILYVHACLWGRNPLIANPALPYVGLLLAAHALRPPVREDGEEAPAMDASLYTVVWILLAVGYTYSGATKLASPSWVDGTGFARLLNNPLARPGFLRDLMLDAPAALTTALTWGALVTELVFAPLSLFRRLRPWMWLAMATMHVGLVCLIDFADLSVGMLLAHAFTFSPTWLRRSGSPQPAP